MARPAGPLMPLMTNAPRGSSYAFSNVVVTYNNRQHVAGLLSDLRTHAAGSPTIVVDNASPDGTAELIRRDFPEVQLTRNDLNVGYARAVNQGMGQVTSPHVFVFNPDIRIASADVFSALQECLDAEPNVAVAAPLQFKADGGRRHLNFTWSYWSPQGFRLYWSYLLRGSSPLTKPLKVSFLNAGCLYLRRSAFDAVGRLNEKYFLYGEEPDLFFKFLRHGYECRLLPAVAVSHAREQSLRTVPSLRRFWFRFLGGLNIADAVARGVAALLYDRLTSRRTD